MKKWLRKGGAGAASALEQWPMSTRPLVPESGTSAEVLGDELAGRGIYHAASRVEINWETVIAQRASVLQRTPGLPPYLLLPEIHQLLRLFKHTHRRLLFASLWVTGARISEALALTPSSFSFDSQDPHALIEIAKRRGRPKKASRARKPRLVPIRTEGYLDQIETFIHDRRLSRDERLFPVTRQAIDAQLRRVVNDYEAQFGALPVSVSCQTLRHSFAVNCILHQVPLPLVQSWLGHEDIQSTMIYTRVLAFESAHMISKVVF